MKKIVFIYFMVSLIALQINAKTQYEKHTVRKGETLFSISHAHGLKVSDIMKANPTLKASTGIRVGQQINIPAKGGHQQYKSSNNSPISEPTQTLNSHFKPKAVSSTPGIAYAEEDERNRNKAKVESATASITNESPVLAKPIEGIEAAPVFSINAGGTNPNDYEALFNEYTEHGYKIADNKGAANYLADNTSGNPYLALYNDAQVGSVIKVTNLMNKKAVFVKVVGRVSRMDSSREIVLKLSQKTADQLGAKDDKFLVEVAGIASN